MFVGLVSVASAEATQVGATVLIVHGTHLESGASAPIGAIPAPLLHARHDVGRFELFAEGIPPFGRVPLGNNGLGISGIELTYLNGVVEYRLSPATRVGIGETIYNQQTTYNQPPIDGFPAQQLDRSRLVGTRYQLDQTLWQTARVHLDLQLALNPHISANLGKHPEGLGVPPNIWVVLPEAGSQVDATLAATATSRKRIGVRYGLRYLNLIMRFPDGSLADRNTLLVPFVDITAPFGR